MELTGIADLADRSPYSLSGGQQQRVALTSILVMQPKVLVLDEPTSQMDPIGTREVFGVIRKMAEQGMTVILVEHKVEWIAQFADRSHRTERWTNFPRWHSLGSANISHSGGKRFWNFDVIRLWHARHKS